MFFADAVTDLAEFVVGALVGNILMIICKAGGIKNQVAVNMFFICMRGKHIFIFSLQNRICDFGADGSLKNVKEYRSEAIEYMSELTPFGVK